MRNGASRVGARQQPNAFRPIMSPKPVQSHDRYVLKTAHGPNCGDEFKIIAADLESAVIEQGFTPLGMHARAPPRVPARGHIHHAARSRPCGPGYAEDGASRGKSPDAGYESCGFARGHAGALRSAGDPAAAQRTPGQTDTPL